MAGEVIRNAVLIAGPTASGKSRLALKLAGERPSVIVNTDSMQVYGVLRILTARPSDADLAAAPHLLYGHVDPRLAYSTGQWLRDVRQIAAGGALDGKQAIFVGGAGLYFRALQGGLAEMPDIPRTVRERWRYRLIDDGPEKLHRLLRRLDPEAAYSIRTSDGQRIVRALEVIDASGRPISDWRRSGGETLIDRAGARLLLADPDRMALRRRIDERFEAMIAAGALKEADAMARLRLAPELPAAKAIGLRELQAYLAGATTLADALERAKARTRQYSKRQITWFRHQLGPGWETVR